ncbi:hypothetical protein Pla175_17260 [Pirellulimonas nuda]|uniref:Cupin domain protein n=1 Tax=Pirellulimonas nuda TaxID=2528009 RepID=A0A518DA37_9BACT|nr:phosrestin [Pirellulimonas nuda]QDU88351.1 hypothetical protein Pla175_17260 [Pirellulimonas nuda]
MQLTSKFDEAPWQRASDLARFKRIESEGYVIRLLQLDAGFEESDWCDKAHIGYVVEGELQVTFQDGVRTLCAGDVLTTLHGPASAHRGAVNHGTVTLFLVDPPQ